MQMTQYIGAKDSIVVAISLVAANSIKEVTEVMLYYAFAGDVQNVLVQMKDEEAPCFSRTAHLPFIFHVAMWAVGRIECALCRPCRTHSHAAFALGLVQCSLSCRRS